MGRHSHPLLWVLLTTGTVLNIMAGNTAEAVEQYEQVKNLTNQQLQTIPPDSNSTVTTLILNGNLIRLNKSDQQALGSYSGLTQLLLDNNEVTDIGAKYFAAVPSLKVLSLSGNKISRLDLEAFSGLDGLTELDLSNNLLTSLPNQLLQALKNLQVLKIQGNPWNCSCEQLQSFKDAQEKSFDFAASNATCASPQSMQGTELIQAIAKCYPAPTTTTITTTTTTTTITTTTNPSTTTNPPKTSTILKPALTPQLNRSLNREQTAVQGNSWKFTASVAALGLTTAVLIVFAIKGPSWYKLFHNYRHRRLHDDSEMAGTTVFHQTPRHPQIYTFESQGRERQTEEEEEEEEEDEDGYFEDPYIRRDE